MAPKKLDALMGAFLCLKQTSIISNTCIRGKESYKKGTQTHTILS